MTSDDAAVLSSLRPEALNAPPSGIIEVFRYGFGRPGLIPLWAGEGDLPTPSFICDAATRSLAAGETFYTGNAGLPELRASLARYHDRIYGGLFGAPFSPDRFVVTSSGMQAIQTVATLIAGAGDEVLIPTPAWPNFAGAVAVRGARAVEVPMAFGNTGWVLDLDRLAAAVTPATRAIFVNSPSNPTGWTADRATLAGLLDLARRHGLWIVADEIYGRFHYVPGEPLAPSFHEIITPDDRVVFVNTFSKNWAMTGWRIGWIELPPALSEPAQKLIQYSTSGTPVFLQKAALTAIETGEDFVGHQVGRARRGLDLVARAFEATGRIRFAAPPGAFYLFFAIDGEPDTRRLGLRLVDEANVGLAPGTAFGDAGSGWMRLCFLRGEEQLGIAVDRLCTWVKTR